MTKTTSRRAQYLRGMRAGLPVVLGFVPVGIAYAVMARQAGFTAAETVLMSLSVFAGASQMMAVGMVAQGAGLAAIILATFLLNLRHVIMSACVNHRLPRSGLAARLLAAFGVTDESFAIFTATPAENCTLPFFFGMITVTYSSWVGGSAIGAAASGLLPQCSRPALAWRCTPCSSACCCQACAATPAWRCWPRRRRRSTRCWAA